MANCNVNVLGVNVLMCVVLMANCRVNVLSVNVLTCVAVDGELQREAAAGGAGVGREAEEEGGA